MINLRDYAQFTGLLIFGNIENLILASQGAGISEGVVPKSHSRFE